MTDNKPIIADMTATVKLARHGKTLVAYNMFQKGKEFYLAAETLKVKQDRTSVYLHLLCQSFEIITKSLLLFKDYEKYNPLLQKKIGHNLIKAYDRYKNDLSVDIHTKDRYKELATLNSFYENHLLRYGTTRDLLIDTGKIQSDKVFKLTKLLIDHMDRKLSGN